MTFITYVYNYKVDVDFLDSLTTGSLPLHSFDDLFAKIIFNSFNLLSTDSLQKKYGHIFGKFRFSTFIVYHV